MFSFTCPRHRTDVLIWPSDIDGIVNTADGIDVHFHCGCGFRGILRTGAGRTERILAGAADDDRQRRESATRRAHDTRTATR